MVEIQIELVDRATIRLNRMPEDVRARLRESLVRDGKQLVALVRAKLSGRVLKMRSGRLLNSIKAQMRESQYALYMRVYSSGVPYARIHEYGGKTRPHLILPKNVQALHFMVKGQGVFAARVNHPGSVIPERSYMRSSLADLKTLITANIKVAGRPKWA